MKQMIYEVYVILPLLLLWRAQFCGKEEWNEGFLSLEQSKAFQGFLAVCIMLHHIGQKTCASWLQPKTRIVHGLDMFVPAGFLMVAVFLFFNGYGVYKSFHAKENYLKGYFGRRILPVVLALYSTTLIFFCGTSSGGGKDRRNADRVLPYQFETLQSKHLVCDRAALFLSFLLSGISPDQKGWAGGTLCVSSSAGIHAPGYFHRSQQLVDPGRMVV